MTAIVLTQIRSLTLGGRTSSKLHVQLEFQVLRRPGAQPLRPRHAVGRLGAEVVRPRA
jgi:hypothetical protein